MNQEISKKTPHKRFKTFPELPTKLLANTPIQFQVLTTLAHPHIPEARQIWDNYLLWP